MGDIQELLNAVESILPQCEAEWTGVSSAYNEKYAVSHGRCQRSAHALKIKFTELQFGHPSGGGELTPNNRVLEILSGRSAKKQVYHLVMIYLLRKTWFLYR